MTGLRVLVIGAMGLLAACAGTSDVPVADVQQDLQSCRSPRPNPGLCHEVSCEPSTGQWVITESDPGSECGRGGTCDGSGNCVGQIPPPPPPPPPSNVHVVDRHPTSITLAWNQSVNATRYEISLNGTVWAAPTGTTATLGQLNQSTQYCYVVTAVGPGGVAAAAPVCAYTGFYLPLGFYGDVLDRPPFAGQTPAIAARVERVQLWAGQNLGAGGSFTLVRPNGHESDCTSGDPDRAIGLAPGQSPLPFQLFNLLGEANPPLNQFGFGFGFDGLWFDACATGSLVDASSPIWLEVNFTLASTIHVVSATYGANIGASGNLTFAVSSLCGGRVFCANPVSNFGPVQDPAPGQAKDFEAQWTCGFDPSLHTTIIPAEAASAVAVLECP